MLGLLGYSRTNRRMIYNDYMGNVYNTGKLIAQSQACEKPSSTCPVCACAFKSNDKLHICDDCETPHHKDCWEYTGGCAIFGCRKGVLRKFEEGRRHDYFLTSLSLSLMRI